MPRFMNINIVTITSDLIFKCFTLQPILESKRIIPSIRRLSLTPSKEAVFTTKALPKALGRSSFSASKYCSAICLPVAIARVVAHGSVESTLSMCPALNCTTSGPIRLLLKCLPINGYFPDLIASKIGLFLLLVCNEGPMRL